MTLMTLSFLVTILKLNLKNRLKIKRFPQNNWWEGSLMENMVQLFKNIYISMGELRGIIILKDIVYSLFLASEALSCIIQKKTWSRIIQKKIRYLHQRQECC